MPKVVKMAMMEQTIKRTLMICSTWLRALSSGRIRLKTTPAKPNARVAMTMVKATELA